MRGGSIGGEIVGLLGWGRGRCGTFGGAGRVAERRRGRAYGNADGVFVVFVGREGAGVLRNGYVVLDSLLGLGIVRSELRIGVSCPRSAYEARDSLDARVVLVM